ncbi:MAG: membrane protein insertase YidC [Candidatus Eisenbacteria bacterium]|nr:membrane protein insertase YidC [Candidatus Eisenbacteria bacterium]
MERRALLAILLATVVLIAYQFLFLGGKNKVPPQVEPRQVRDTTIVLEKIPPSIQASSRNLFKNHNPGDGKNISFETSVAACSLSTVDGNISYWALKKFEGRNGAPFQFLRPGHGNEPSMLLSVGGRNLEFNKTYFSSKESLDQKTGSVRKVEFYARDAAGIEVKKIFRFTDNDYFVDLEVRISGIPDTVETASYSLRWSAGLPYGEENTKIDDGSFASVTLVGDELHRENPQSFKKEPSREKKGNVMWAGVRNKYFLAAVVPPSGKVSKVVTFGDPQTKSNGFELTLPLSSGMTVHKYMVYLGPADYWYLKKFNIGLEKTVDLGWKWVIPFTQLLLKFFVICYRWIPNYGLVIIVLSIISRVVFYPLTKTSFRSMKEMQRVQPEVAALKKKFKDDSQRFNKEVMALYKKHKVNPFGGCLPLLVQMPVFVALYSVLMNAIELRRSEFGLWINDLASPDTLFSIAGFPVHILPLLMTVTMFIQQKLTPTDPRQALMGYIMPVFMLVIFYSLPSGLVLYWTITNLMTVIQQYMIHREDKTRKPAPVAA